MDAWQGSDVGLSRLGSVLRTRWGAVSDIGPSRPSNQDAWLAEPPLFAVADGMGGHEAGELASATAVATLRQHLTARDPGVFEVDRAVCQAAVAVAELMDDPLSPSAPGTTLTGLVGTSYEGRPAWLVFNVGDSKVFLVAGDSIIAVTEEHVAVLPDGAQVLTRALGAGMPGLPESGFFLVPARRGDRFVVCSDGLHRALPEAQLHALTMRAPDPQTASAQLVDGAIAAGTRDNVTALVVECLEAMPDGEGSHEAADRQIVTVRRASKTTTPTTAREG